MRKENNQKWYLRIIQSKWLVLILSILIVVVNAIVQAQKKDWTWVLITISVLAILLILIILLSFLMRKEREDIMQSIIREDGLLDKYLQQKNGEFNSHLQEKIDNFNKHGKCLSDLQNKCNKRILQNFFEKEYIAIKFYEFDDILKLEKEIENGEIWIVTDDVETDKQNEDVYNIVSSNIKEGTKYRYFYNNQSGASEAINMIKNDLETKFTITDIEDKIEFIPVSVDYNALLTIAKDVIILQPYNSSDREAFLCIYASKDFKIAFYRKLNFSETNVLVEMCKKLLPKKKM